MNDDITTLKQRLEGMAKQSLFIMHHYSPITQNVMIAVTGHREHQHLVIRMSKEEVSSVIEILEMMEE